MSKSLAQILEKEEENLFEAVLSDFSELNASSLYTAEEWGESPEKIEADNIKVRDRIDGYNEAIGKIKHQRALIKDGNGETYKEAIFNDLPYIKTMYNDSNNIKDV